LQRRRGGTKRLPARQAVINVLPAPGVPAHEPPTAHHAAAGIAQLPEAALAAAHALHAQVTNTQPRVPMCIAVSCTRPISDAHSRATWRLPLTSQQATRCRYSASLVVEVTKWYATISVKITTPSALTTVIKVWSASSDMAARR
jgi:hypothetical protein